MATAVFPAAVATDTQLPNVGDAMNPSTTLNGSINNTVTTIACDDITDFASAGYFIIGEEIVIYSGQSSNSFTGCTRGSLGSSASAHTDGAALYAGPVGRMWDQFSEEIKAIETELGVDPAGSEATVVARLDASDTTQSSHTTSIADLETRTSAIILSGTGAVAHGAGTTVFQFVNSSLTEAIAEGRMPFAGTLKNMGVDLDIAPGVGKNIVITARKNQVDTSLTVTVAETAVSGVDNSNEVTFAKGDNISFKCVNHATSATTFVTIICEYLQT